MSSKMKSKLVTDCLMTVVLLLLMSYSLIGEAFHEWLGIVMLLLFFLHQFWNFGWYKNLRKGRYSALRILQTGLIVLILLSMLGSMFSGIALSQYALDFLPVRSGRAVAKIFHLPCAYWSFVLMSLHLGLHWGMVLSMARRLVGGKSPAGTAVARAFGGLAAVYGAVSFYRHDLLSYLLLRTHFVFFDFEQPPALFFADYSSIMGLFVFLGYCAGKLLKTGGRPQSPGKGAAL